MTQTLEQADHTGLGPSDSGPSRDDLRRGVIQTQVSGGVAWTMIGLFLAIVFGIPIQQAIVELRDHQRPAVMALAAAGRFPTRSDLKQYEDSLQEQSRAVRYFQPRLQEWLCRWGGYGSTNVVLGHDGWLFYRPGIDSVTGPGFLDPVALHHRCRNWRDAAVIDTIQPDPRPAILEFKAQLEAAGVQLIVMPIPDKATVQGDRLSRGAASTPARNLSFAAFVEELRRSGVEIFDPSPSTVDPNEVRFLTQDTHWTPQWMDEVAKILASRIRGQVAPRTESKFLIESRTIVGEGDLTEMLRLTDHQDLLPPQSVTIQQVVDRSGQCVRPNPRSAILLLGDSFTNIYSTPQMGWGNAAGLAEHLSFHLGEPIDWIARNDAGAHASREMLASQMALGKNRLAGKKIVIWEFAARELSLGDWRLLPVPK